MTLVKNRHHSLKSIMAGMKPEYDEQTGRHLIQHVWARSVLYILPKKQDECDVKIERSEI